MPSSSSTSPSGVNPPKAHFADQYTLEERAELFWRAIEVINKNENFIWGDASLSALVCTRKFQRNEALGIDEALDIFRSAKVTGLGRKAKGLEDAKVDFVDFDSVEFYSGSRRFRKSCIISIRKPDLLEKYLSADSREGYKRLLIECEVDRPELDCPAITSLACVKELTLPLTSTNRCPLKMVCPRHLTCLGLGCLSYEALSPPITLSDIPNSLTVCSLRSIRLQPGLDLSPAVDSLQKLILWNVEFQHGDRFLDLSLPRRLVQFQFGSSVPSVPMSLSGIPNSLMVCFLRNIRLQSALDFSPAADSLKKLILWDMEFQHDSSFLDISMLQSLDKFEVVDNYRGGVPSQLPLIEIKLPPSVVYVTVSIVDRPFPRVDFSLLVPCRSPYEGGT